MKKYKQNYLLFEQDIQDTDIPEENMDVDGKLVARKADDSVDDQIDSLILMYEKESIRDEIDSINESLTRLSLKILLREQEEESIAPAEASEEPEEEEPAEEPTGSEEISAKPADKQKIPDLDIDKFTIDVARLVMNHKQLLDVEKAIINRTKNFLDNNYGDAFVARFLSTLEEQFGLSIDEFSNEDVQDAPFAIGANPAGAGSVGGG
jgi:hypothetical protein